MKVFLAWRNGQAFEKYPHFLPDDDTLLLFWWLGQCVGHFCYGKDVSSHTERKPQLTGLTFILHKHSTKRLIYITDLQRAGPTYWPKKCEEPGKSELCSCWHQVKSHCKVQVPPGPLWPKLSNALCHGASCKWHQQYYLHSRNLNTLLALVQLLNTFWSPKRTEFGELVKKEKHTEHFRRVSFGGTG